MGNKKTLDEEIYPIRVLGGNFKTMFTFQEIIDFIKSKQNWDYEVMYEDKVIPAAEFVIKQTILRYMDSTPGLCGGYTCKIPAIITKDILICRNGKRDMVDEIFFNNKLNYRYYTPSLDVEFTSDTNSPYTIYPMELQTILEAFENLPELSKLPLFPFYYVVGVARNTTPTRKSFWVSNKFQISDLQDPRELQILKKRFSITAEKDINKCITNMENNNSFVGDEIHASPDSPYAHPTPPKTFREIAEAQINLYESKNADYGDAADKLFDSYGLNYYLIMLEQKLLRIKNLNEKQDKANNESIEDSLLDMSNYAILAVESLRKKK